MKTKATKVATAKVAKKAPTLKNTVKALIASADKDIAEHVVKVSTAVTKEAMAQANTATNEQIKPVVEKITKTTEKLPEKRKGRLVVPDHVRQGKPNPERKKDGKPVAKKIHKSRSMPKGAELQNLLSLSSNTSKAPQTKQELARSARMPPSRKLSDFVGTSPKGKSNGSISDTGETMLSAAKAIDPTLVTDGPQPSEKFLTKLHKAVNKITGNTSDKIPLTAVVLGNPSNAIGYQPIFKARAKK